MIRLLLCIVLGISCFFGSIVMGQEKPLKLSIRREWEGSRSSAPLSLKAFAKWQREELLEGHYRVQAFVDTRRISLWTSDEIALSNSEQSIWFMSPRPILSNTAKYVLEAELIGNRPGLEFEQLDVEVPVRTRRVMVVGLIVDKGTTVPAGMGTEFSHNAFEENLALHNFVTPLEAGDFHLHVSRVEPKEFPIQPLRLLGLDALIVPHDMLGRLNETQREALRIWVRAGASMLVIRTGQLTPVAEEWLQDLTLDPWSSEVLQGRHLPTNLAGFDVGVGQLLILDRGLDGASVEWRQTVGELLRLRPERTHEMANSRKLQLAPPDLGDDPLFSKLEPRGRIHLSGGEGSFHLQEVLMPDSVRGMPFWLAASVLGLCLLCIGPLDYWVLGVMRRRRWTWLVFPVVALGFTGWMAQLAADHNGRNDARNWLSIVDVTPTGEVLRTTRLELTYGASARVVPHEVRNQWWSDLRQIDLISIWDPANSRQQNDQDRLEFSGDVPDQYVVSEPVGQWSARMQRITTLGADPDLAEYSLPRLDRKVFQQWYKSLKSPSAKSPVPPSPGTIIGITVPGKPVQWSLSAEHQNAQTRLSRVAALLNEVLTAGWEKQSGIFYVLRELSPTAGPDCEDLVCGSHPTGLVLQEVEPGRFLLTRTVFPTWE